MTEKPQMGNAIDNLTGNFIDIDEVFRKRGGKLYPVIPKFLINYLKRTVHQDYINETINMFHDKMGLDFVEKILNERFTAEISTNHLENIPLHGRYILASNHPLGGLDGLALMHAVGKRRKDIKFIVNDILFELKNLQELFVPVNKHGRNSVESVRVIESVYESDDLILIFPAGLVSRKQKKGEIKDLDWKKSFITKSIRHKRDIIPVHIDGQNSSFFYNLANLRKKAGIKLNIEMLYLPDEMFKQSNKNISITFGKAIPYTTFTGSKTHQQWAQWVKSKVYQLAQEPAI